MKSIIKSVLKIVTSIKFVELLDKNGDGRVSLEEVKKAPLSAKLEIAGELAVKLAPYIISLVL